MLRQGWRCVLDVVLCFCYLFRKWIEHSKLREINFKIVEFNPVVLKGKIRPDSSRPELLQPVSRDYTCREWFLVRCLFRVES